MANLDSIGPIENESVSNVTLTPSVMLGTQRTVAGVNYIYCYNNGNTQISVGQPATIQPASMLSGFSVCVSNAASQTGGELVVGVVYHNTMATAAYGWLVTKGVCTGVPDATATSMNSGDFLAIGVDGGFVVAPVTISTGIRLGVCLNSFVTAGGRIMFKSPLFG